MPTLQLRRTLGEEMHETVATIECREEDIKRVVSIFELFDKSVKDIKIIHVGKKGTK